MKKKATLCLVAIISVVMLASLTISVFAKIADDNAVFTGYPKNQWELEHYVSPVTLKIRELKSKGLTDLEIVAELEKFGMGWDPITGQKWVGRRATPEELAELEARQSSLYLDRTPRRVSVMRTNSDDWRGVATEMISGSMNRASDETETHYLCTQFGDLNNLEDWIEIVLMHNLNDPYEWWTWDENDTYTEGIYHFDKTTSTSSADTLCIMVTSYNYYICWINYVNVREGFLWTDDGYVGYQKEVYSDNEVFTDDDSEAVFWRNWVYDGSGWDDWDNTITGGTWFQDDDPVQINYSVWQGYYWFETWVEN